MANFNLNKVILGGRMTADPELKTTPSGVSVTTFPLAVNRRANKDGESVPDFFSVTAWRNTAEFVSRFFRKGSSICVIGSIQTRTWKDNNGEKRFGIDIIADEVAFVDSKSEMPDFQPGTKAESAAKKSPPPNIYSTPGARDQFSGANMEELGDDEELPF